MLKKCKVSTILGAVAAICALLAFIFYLVNCNTQYFKSSGVNAGIVVSLIFAIVFEVAYALVPLFDVKYGDIITAVCAVAGAVFGMIALITLAGARIAGIASIMTFEGNATTQANMVSAIVAIVFTVVAAIVAIVASFFKTNKD